VGPDGSPVASDTAPRPDSFGQTPVQRPHGRAADGLRPVRLAVGELKFAEGSAQLELGDTRVLAAASVEGRVPPFLAGSGKGWVTAEYAMLPRATSTRNAREVNRGRPSGRTSEIQRLIGRSLRAIVDQAALGEHTITVDCDVLQADGGTRTAAVTAGYVALAQAAARLLLTGEISRWPLLEPVAAVSVGIVRGAPVLDLEYSEDQEAAVDMNVVATASGKLVEVQGTGEGRSFDRAELDFMLDLALGGIGRLLALQREALAPVLAEVEEALQGRTRERKQPKREKDLWGAPGR
jgi:ribonuclease PH